LLLAVNEQVRVMQIGNPFRDCETQPASDAPDAPEMSITMSAELLATFE
jgi:hypothetical protein